MDAITLYAAGITGVVASMGTAITPQQLTLAARTAMARGGRRLVLCLDNDAAGVATVERLCSNGMLSDTIAKRTVSKSM